MMRVIHSLSAGVLFGLVSSLGCDTTYSPGFAAVDVSCTVATSTAAGTWMFSSWVVDEDGPGDVARVDVALLDFSGNSVKSISLARTEETYWSSTWDENQLGIPCKDLTLYLYTFRAVDQNGQEATTEFLP